MRACDSYDLGVIETETRDPRRVAFQYAHALDVACTEGGRECRLVCWASSAKGGGRERERREGTGPPRRTFTPIAVDDLSINVALLPVDLGRLGVGTALQFTAFPRILISKRKRIFNNDNDNDNNNIIIKSNVQVGVRAVAGVGGSWSAAVVIVFALLQHSELGEQQCLPQRKVFALRVDTTPQLSITP